VALILTIDDDEALRRTVRRILTGAGHTVIDAEDGTVGMKRLRKEQPDLVVTDILMPNKDGIETIREIRAVSPRTKVIATSGGGISGNAMFLDMAQAFGADAVLRKPFRAADLLAAVDRLLADE
jgi:CheY-like chemotaxis protein